MNEREPGPPLLRHRCPQGQHRGLCASRRPRRKQAATRTYRIFRNDLIRMRTWLKQPKAAEIAIESTGVYSRPVWNVLEEQGFRLLLVNPAQVKALAGRKSDGRDCKRIAEFLEDGRLDGSFVPAREIRELRVMVRQRVSLLEQRNEVHNEIRDLMERGAEGKFHRIPSGNDRIVLRILSVFIDTDREA